LIVAFFFVRCGRSLSVLFYFIYLFFCNTGFYLASYLLGKSFATWATPLKYSWSPPLSSWDYRHEPLPYPVFCFIFIFDWCIIFLKYKFFVWLIFCCFPVFNFIYFYTLLFLSFCLLWVYFAPLYLVLRLLIWCFFLPI
jgi:hypothetical protein